MDSGLKLLLQFALIPIALWLFCYIVNAAVEEDFELGDRRDPVLCGSLILLLIYECIVGFLIVHYLTHM